MSTQRWALRTEDTEIGLELTERGIGLSDRHPVKPESWTTCQVPLSLPEKVELGGETERLRWEFCRRGLRAGRKRAHSALSMQAAGADFHLDCQAGYRSGGAPDDSKNSSSMETGSFPTGVAGVWNPGRGNADSMAVPQGELGADPRVSTGNSHQRCSP